MSEDVNDYEVGYGKPPKHSQFKKGRSGNPKGRPRGDKNVGTMVRETFLRKIPITENGKQKKVSILEALLRQMVNAALKGEARQLDRVMKLLPVLEVEIARQKAAGPEGAGGEGSVDISVLEVFADMFGSDPEDLYATIQGGVDSECPEY